MSISELPPELAAHGTPEQVFAPDEEKKIPLLLVLGVLVATILAMASLGLAAFFFGFFGFGQHPPPPPGVQWMMGGLFGLGGVASLGWALWMASGAHHCTQTYLLFKDVLVEQFPNRHRVIRWDQLGVPDPESTIKEYRYPVRDGKAIQFDFTMPDHAELAKALTRQGLLGRLSGGVAALATGAPAPFFLVSPIAMLATGKTFRVSVLGQDLLFLHVGIGSEGPPEAYDPYKFDVSPLWMRALAAWKKEEDYLKFKKKMDQVAAADERSLFRVAGEYEGSFILSGGGLRELRISPPSGWQFLTAGGPVLTLNHASEGQTTWRFISVSEIATAAQEMARVCPGLQITAGDPVQASWSA